MDSPLILFFGQYDVQIEIFQTFAESIGFRFSLTQDTELVFTTLAALQALIIIIIDARGNQLQLASLAREIREQAPGTTCPIFILSEKPFDPCISHSTVLTKPAPLHELAKHLARYKTVRP